MKVFKYINNFHWQIAYRDNRVDEKYHLIKNPSWAWAADPFLVEYQNEIYLFAELFLYKTERKGVIGYCKYKNGTFTPWTVTMDKKWHLSYPNVFVMNDELYMCPESWQREEIGLYKLIEFPNKWEKIKTIVDNIQCVDSTFLKKDGQLYMFTYQIKDPIRNDKLLKYKLDNDFNPTSMEVIGSGKGWARPGGNFLYKGDRLVRVSQDCTTTYGGALVFSEVESIEPYSEKILEKRLADSFIYGLPLKYCGVHTYNCLDNIEVIDLKFEKKSIREHWARKRVRKVFLDKY